MLIFYVFYGFYCNWVKLKNPWRVAIQCNSWDDLQDQTSHLWTRRLHVLIQISVRAEYLVRRLVRQTFLRVAWYQRKRSYFTSPIPFFTHYIKLSFPMNLTLDAHMRTLFPLTPESWEEIIQITIFTIHWVLWVNCCWETLEYSIFSR